MRFVTTNYNTINYKTFEKFKDVKVIIFDFDDTLYKYLKWTGYNDFFINNVRNMFPELTNNQFNFYLKKYKIINSDRVSENTAKLLLDLHGSTAQLVNFLNTIKYPCNWAEGQIFPQSLLEKLSKKYKLFIVSNSSEPNIKFVSKNMGINLKFFTSILSNKFDIIDLTKVSVFKKIIKNENLLPSEFLMVGDSIKYDLLPAKKLGFKTLLIKD